MNRMTVHKLLKKYFKFIIIGFIFIFVYWIGTWNFSIIKPSFFFSTAFYEKEYGTWICEEHNLVATNSKTEPHIMILEDNNTGTTYKLAAHGDYFVELFSYDNQEERIWSSAIYNYKRWGKVHKFVLLSKLESNPWNDSSLTFIKKQSHLGMSDCRIISD